MISFKVATHVHAHAHALSTMLSNACIFNDLAYRVQAIAQSSQMPTQSGTKGQPRSRAMRARLGGAANAWSQPQAAACRGLRSGGLTQ